VNSPPFLSCRSVRCSCCYLYLSSSSIRVYSAEILKDSIPGQADLERHLRGAQSRVLALYLEIEIQATLLTRRLRNGLRNLMGRTPRVTQPAMILSRKSVVILYRYFLKHSPLAQRRPSTSSRRSERRQK